MDKTLSDAILVANNDGITDRDIANAVEVVIAARRAQAKLAGMVAVRHPSLPEVSVNVPPDAVEVYERSGWHLVPDEPPDDETGDGLPKGNASREEWAAYALGHGLTAADVEPLSRDEIRDHFQNEETSA